MRNNLAAYFMAEQSRAAQAALRGRGKAQQPRAAQAALRCEAPMGQALPARRALKPHVFGETPAATADVSVRYLVFWIVLYHTL